MELYPGIYILTTREAHRCRRVISENCTKSEPRRLDEFTSIEPPSIGANLQRLSCVLQAVKPGILNVFVLVSHLQKFMESKYEKSSKKPTYAAAGVQLNDLNFGHIESYEFKNCREALVKRIALSHRNRNKRLGVFSAELR